MEGIAMSGVVNDILATRLIGIIRMKTFQHPVEIARALMAGGINVIEYTMSSDGALECIRAVREALGDSVRVGAGTVITAAKAEDAIAAGAEFIVTPAVSLDVLTVCNRRGAPVVCGAFTPSEIMTALDAGADLIKLFPARLGGPQYVRDLLGPFPDLRLAPIGGVNIENAPDYFTAGAVAVAVGGNLIAEEIVMRRQWSEIEDRARAYRAVVPTEN